jgi:hypothetical protein
VRLHGPGASGWTPVMTGGEIGGSSRVATGVGGRMILARPGVQIAAGTASAFVLADPDARPLRQEAGRLRYRVERAADAPFVVETPFMRVRTQGAIFDIAVRPDGGEVTVEKGRLLVTTSDGARGATLEAGQVAFSRTVESEHLMVREGSDEAAAPADPSVVTVAPQDATAALHAVARAVPAPEPAPSRTGTSPAVQRLAAEPPSAGAILPAGYREDEPQALPRDDDAEAPLAVRPAPEPQTAAVDAQGPGVAGLTDGLLEALGTAPAPGSTRPSRPGAL